MSNENVIKGIVPFTLYDFFGYLFPGVTLVTGIFFYYHSFLLDSVFCTNLKTFYNEFTGLFSTAAILAGLVLVYILGHFIATISHITIDRIIVGTILKYPYTTLLGIDENVRDFAYPMHKLVLLLTFIIWVLSIFAVSIPMLRSYVILGIYAIIILNILRLFLVFIKGLFPSLSKKKINRNSLWYWVLFRWYSYLIDIFIINPIRYLLSIDRGFDEEYAYNIRQLIRKRYGVYCTTARSDNFWLPCLEIMKQPEYSRMTNNWLHLYGLNRNMCMSFVLLSAYTIVNHFILKYNVMKSDQLIMIISIIASVVFGARYITLYYTYYSKNVFRFFYIDQTS